MKKFFILFILVLGNILYGQTDIAPSGSGSELDPYLITSLANLYWISVQVNGNPNNDFSGKYFRQTQNIDASETTTWFPNGAGGYYGWVPIGHYDFDLSIFRPFSGVYDGNNKIIDGIYVNRPGENYQGFFGYTKSLMSGNDVVFQAEIKNLGVTNVNITGKDEVGSFAGSTRLTLVNECYSTGVVNSMGTMDVGGFSGFNQQATLTDCYSTCTVTGNSTDGVGGLVGCNMDDAVINKCYSTGSVSGLASVGGLVGFQYMSTVSNSFWNTETSGQVNGVGVNDGGTITNVSGKNTALMETQTTFTDAGWDFTTIWEMSSPIIDGSPHLKWEGFPEPANTPIESDGIYQISSLNDLRWIAENPIRWSYEYIQTADIDFDDAVPSINTWDAGKGWTPIGSNWGSVFSGTYDGNNFTISNIYINRTGINNLGLFGFAQGANIKNLGLINVNITGASYIGGLVGYNISSSVISKCFCTGSIIGNNCLGGLVGSNIGNTTIEYSYSNVTVSGAVFIGGFVGSSTQDGFGGLPVIKDCYSRSNVIRSSGTDHRVGGFIGENYDASILRCYSTGTVTSIAGSNPTDKGFAGQVLPAGTVSGNFWDIETSSQSTSLGATGITTTEMKTQSTFIDAGWDINIWNMGDGINNGYPYLKWQNSGGTPLPVELTFFVASEVNNKINLKWQTATEVNSYGFQVERLSVISSQSSVIADNPLVPSGNAAIQNPQWEVVGFVEGNGNSNSPKEYSFVDNLSNLEILQSCNLQYRLKQIDTDGSFEYYSTIAEVNYNLSNVKEKQIPTEFALKQNYPNPFNPSTVISYTIGTSQLSVISHVTLMVFDILGNEVATLVNEVEVPGYYQVKFDAGKYNLSSGTYFYRINAGEFTSTKKLMIMK